MVKLKKESHLFFWESYSLTFRDLLSSDDSNNSSRKTPAFSIHLNRKQGKKFIAKQLLTERNLYNLIFSLFNPFLSSNFSHQEPFQSQTPKSTPPNFPFSSFLSLKISSSRLFRVIQNYSLNKEFLLIFRSSS